MEPVRARAQAHWRVAVAIISAMGVSYGALILLIAYGKPLLGRILVPGLSVAILFSSVVTIVAWILTLFYVRWANAYDGQSERRRPSDGRDE